MAEKKEQIVHELIPELSKLSDKDVKSLLKEYNITTRELPKILITDAAIAHLDIEEGSVIKIKRKSRTAGDTVFYRVVVKE